MGEVDTPQDIDNENKANNLINDEPLPYYLIYARRRKRRRLGGVELQDYDEEYFDEDADVEGEFGEEMGEESL